jgi:hypothetical protein
LTVLSLESFVIDIPTPRKITIVFAIDKEIKKIDVGSYFSFKMVINGLFATFFTQLKPAKDTKNALLKGVKTHMSKFGV